jgi:16S rRNA (uracil1498-N3)-methyltransferase
MENCSKIHRFICAFDERDGRATVTAPEAVHQMRRVLKLTPGETIGLCRGDGRELRLRLTGISGEAVVGEVIGRMEAPAARRRVELLCAVLKRENFEWVAAKATEVGVAAIVPLLTSRTVKTALRADRIGRIIRESAEQCGRCDLPTLSEPVPLADALSRGQGVFFDASGPSPEAVRLGEDIRIFIGPEGGWTPVEISLAAKSGCTIASLGGLTLRAETAAVVASHWACWQ